MPTMQQLAESEFMSLADDSVGIIPEEFRNRGYDKLDYAPGEGGIHIAGQVSSGAPAAAGGVTLESFLAGVAAGADPQEFAKELLSGSTARPRRRRAAAATEQGADTSTDE